jgi:hypothetical protein
MTERHPPEKTRRTFIKGAAAVGVAATGITAFSGSAAAQEPDLDDVSVGDPDEDGIEVRDLEIDIEKGNRNAQFQNLDVEITDVGDEDDAEDGETTADGVVSGTVLPNENANESAAKDFEVEFEDAILDIGEIEDEDNFSRLVELRIPDLFLDVLGLQVSLDLDLTVDADPEGGLLGQLLANLGRELEV